MPHSWCCLLWPQTAFDLTRWERAEPVDGPVAEAMSALAAECGILLHAAPSSSASRRPAPRVSLANTSLFFGADGLIVTYRKIHRLASGRSSCRSCVGAEVVLVELPSGERAALSTCYDLRFPSCSRRH